MVNQWHLLIQDVSKKHREQKMILPLNGRRKLRVKQELFPSRGEEYEFILDVFSHRYL